MKEEARRLEVAEMEQKIREEAEKMNKESEFKQNEANMRDKSNNAGQVTFAILKSLRNLLSLLGPIK